MQKGARDADRVTAFRPEVPEAVAEVIAHCLARDPAERPQSMRSLEYELTRAVDGRAQAVAAVLGLNMAGDSGPRSRDDPSPAASASFHRAAIASLDTQGHRPVSEHTEIAAPPRRPVHSGPERTVVAPPPRRPASEPVVTQPAPVSHSAPELSRANATALAAVKAVFFVLLGGGIATAAVLMSRDDPPAEGKAQATKAAADGGASKFDPSGADDSTKAADDGGADPTAPADGAAADDGAAGDAGATGAAPDTKQADSGADPTGGEDIVIDPTEDEPIIEEPSKPATVEQLVAQAEAALDAGAWREPPEKSLVMALTNLELREPGNEALTRLRRAARDKLKPEAEKAMDGKRWGDAVTAYRDLLAVWPGHPAQAQLVEALHEQGRVLVKSKDWETVLATADELVKFDDEDFRAHMLRGDSLYALARYDEAREAYNRALKLKPRNKVAKKKRRNAIRKARSQQG